MFATPRCCYMMPFSPLIFSLMLARLSDYYAAMLRLSLSMLFAVISPPDVIR